MNYKELIFGQHKGTTQHGRFTKALAPDYAKIDGRSLEELMAFVAEYAKVIQFYNQKDEVTGSWHPLLIKDVSVILANIVATDLTRIETEHNRILDNIQNTYDTTKKLESLDELALFILKLLQEIDTWYRQITKINIQRKGIEGSIEQELRAVIEMKLNGYLIELLSYLAGAKAAGHSTAVINIEEDTFDSIWEIEDILEVDIFDGDNIRDKIISAKIQYQLLYRNVFNKYSFIVLKFKKYFHQSIESKSNHKPDVGLLIAFLQLFKYTQTDLNSLSSRLLEFYYLNVLNQERRVAIPDTVHVCFEAAEHVEEHLIPKGTKLIAGRDDYDDEILYATDEDLQVNRAQIIALKTLFLSNKDESTSSYETISRIYAADIANSKDGQGQPFNRSNVDWALFGEEQNSDVNKTMSSAEMGLAITSPILFLKEGKRKVTLKFTFTKDSTEFYKILLDDIRDVQLERNDDTSQDPFLRLFPQGDNQRNLRIQLSSVRNWININPETIKISQGKKGSESLNQLHISFEIPTAAPPVTAYDYNSLNDKRYITSSPLMKLLISDEKAPYLYTFIRDLMIERIDIDVDVRGVKSLQIYNEFGRLDPTQPFQAFGNQPAIGSYLMVGNSEIFKKQINSLQFNLEWLKIPETVGSFRKHYAQYNGKYSPEQYRVRLKALSDYEFFPENGDTETEMYLFEDNPNRDAILKSSTLYVSDRQIEKLNIKSDPYLSTINDYDNDTKSGYFKLELVEPATMFGHEIYPRLFTEIVTENALKGNNGEAMLDIPNEPYTPTVKEFSINYRASTSINIKGYDERRLDKIFHVHPFGIERIYPNPRSKKNNYLLPQYEKDAYLYIGLEDVVPLQQLSLLFQLTANKSKGDTKYEPPQITWSYLARNRWKDFQDIHHLSDTTDKFTKTGVIKLIMPEDISPKNNILPNAIFWLRIAIKGDTEILCRAIDIRTQVVSCKWLPTSDSRRLSEPLAPFSITDFEQDRTEIQTVTQPFESFGGLPKEDFKALSGRVSEALRHKGRAITKWDYERIILERFHEIAQVKCLNLLNNYQEDLGAEVRSFEEESGVVIVVVPRRRKFLEDNKPRVNYRVLQNIEDYLATKISAFAKLRVRNPGYEYIRIVCDVKFEEKGDSGRLLQRFKRDINKYISPWLFHDKKTIPIGAAIDESAVQDYIRGLSYIQFLTKFSILHIIRDDDGSFTLNDTASDNEEVAIIQTRPWGVFVPDDHEISIITSDDLYHELPKKRNNIYFQGSRILKSRSRRIKINKRPHFATPKAKNNNKSYQLKINLPNESAE